LGELVGLQRGHDLPSGKRVPGTIPVVGSGGITGWHNEPKASGPGITIGRAANLGVPTLIEEDFWPLNTTLYVTDFRGNNVRFTYHLFQVLDLAGFNSGSVQPMLNRNYISSFPIKVPERPEQDAIASVLGALDDKIDVNERVANVTRQLGLALFTQAVLKEEPVEVEIGSVTSTLTRGISPKYSESLDDLMVLNQKCIRDGRVNLTHARRTLRERVKSPKLLQCNDVLVNSTGVGTLGRVARWMSGNTATVDSHITIVRFNETQVDPLCAGFAMLRAQPEIEAMGEGSTGQTELRRTQLGSLEITIPSKSQQQQLRPRLDTLEEQAHQVLAESRALVSLRDTLLPQLMSGRLRVKDAEKIVEDHV
jgi:type I restriction enzyme S subunit